MDLNNYFNTGKKRKTFKAVIREKTNKGLSVFKFFIYAYNKEEAMNKATKMLKQDHPELCSKKISLEEV